MFFKKRILLLFASFTFSSFYSAERGTPVRVFLLDLEYFFEDNMNGVVEISSSNLLKLFANDPMRENIRPIPLAKELKCFARNRLFRRDPECAEHYYKIEDSDQAAIYHWICECFLTANNSKMSMIFLIALVAKNVIGECFIEMDEVVRKTWINNILSYPKLLQESGMFREFCLWAKDFKIEGIALPKELPEAKVAVQQELGQSIEDQEKSPSPSPSVRSWARQSANQLVSPLSQWLAKPEDPSNGTSLLRAAQSESDSEQDEEPKPKMPCERELRDQRKFCTSRSF